MKIQVEYLEYMWPMRHFLITCGNKSKKLNIIAVSFCTPVSKDPLLIACAIGRNTCSCQLIENTKEFIINITNRVPSAEFGYFWRDKYNRRIRIFHKSKWLRLATRLSKRGGR